MPSSACALIRSLGFTGTVKSPTYGLLETYCVAGWKIIHLDLYRIEDPEELEYLALADQLDSRSLLLVEWPAKAESALPAPDLDLHFIPKGDALAVNSFAHSDSGIVLANKALRDFHDPSS